MTFIVFIVDSPLFIDYMDVLHLSTILFEIYIGIYTYCLHKNILVYNWSENCIGFHADS